MCETLFVTLLQISIVFQICVLKVNHSIIIRDSRLFRLVERFLMDQYKPRQLSTYALTVFRHLAKDAAGKEISIDFWDTYGLSGGVLYNYSCKMV